MRKIIVFLVLLYGVGLSAQTSLHAIFEQSNEQYRLEKYQEALQGYQRIIDSGYVSSELYYNIANAYYKLKSVANSIYYYKKALAVDPDNQDAQHNLSFVRSTILDDIKPLPKTFVQSLKTAFFTAYKTDTWTIIMLALLFLSSVLFVFFYFGQREWQRRLFFGLFFLFALSFIGVATLTFLQYQSVKNKKEAVIFAEKIAIQEAPYEKSETIFTLHEGTEVEVLDKVASWYKIRIADGNVGWVDKEAIKLL